MFNPIISELSRAPTWIELAFSGFVPTLSKPDTRVELKLKELCKNQFRSAAFYIKQKNYFIAAFRSPRAPTEVNLMFNPIISELSRAPAWIELAFSGLVPTLSKPDTRVELKLKELCKNQFGPACVLNLKNSLIYNKILRFIYATTKSALLPTKKNILRLQNILTQREQGGLSYTAFPFSKVSLLELTLRKSATRLSKTVTRFKLAFKSSSQGRAQVRTWSYRFSQCRFWPLSSWAVSKDVVALLMSLLAAIVFVTRRNTFVTFVRHAFVTRKLKRKYLFFRLSFFFFVS